MGKTLLWIEFGGCSGESMAILGLDGPFVIEGYNLAQFLEGEGVRLLWHPSLSLESPLQLLSIVDSIVCGKEELTLFCVEGSVINGPNGTGMYDSIHGKPKRDLIAALCHQAEYVLAMGTCAAFEGIPAAAPNPTDSSGLQFSLDKPGGLLSPEWRSRAGFPVFNLSGCPVDAVTMLRTMSLIIKRRASGAGYAESSLHRPAVPVRRIAQEVPHSRESGIQLLQLYWRKISHQQAAVSPCGFLSIGNWILGGKRSRLCNRVGLKGIKEVIS